MIVLIWWPSFLRKPKLRLKKPNLSSPPKPSSTTLFILSLALIIFVFSGGIYAIVNAGKPGFIPFGSTSSGQLIFIEPSLNRQLALEGFIAGFFIIVGFLGFFLIYEGTRQSQNVYRPGYAERLMIYGLFLVGLSYALLVWMLQFKLGG